MLIWEFHLGSFQFRDTQSIIIGDWNKENNLNRNKEKETSESIQQSFTLIFYYVFFKELG